jgi:hypothetical protein
MFMWGCVSSTVHQISGFSRTVDTSIVVVLNAKLLNSSFFLLICNYLERLVLNQHISQDFCYNINTCRCNVLSI